MKERNIRERIRSEEEEEGRDGKEEAWKGKERNGMVGVVLEEGKGRENGVQGVVDGEGGGGGVKGGGGEEEGEEWHRRGVKAKIRRGDKD